MDRAQVHFELFVRRHRRAPWTLALATEDRRAAFEAIDDVTAGDRDAAVRLCKETRDPATGEFRPLVLVERGVKAEPRRRRWTPPLRRPPVEAGARAACVQPQDLYGTPARQAIGRHLAGWLGRNGVTPFELLHRADLAEQLEACRGDLSTALSNAALEQAGAAGAGMDRIRRGLEALARRTIERIVRSDPEPVFQLGMMVAERLARCEGWRDKAALLLDLLDAAPGDGAGAQVATRMLQQPLVDILGAHGDLADLFGGASDPGDGLLVLLQVALAPEVAAAKAASPALARLATPLRGLSARLALMLHARPGLARTRWAMVRRVVAALADEALLWPDDPDREIDGLRALAALLARAGRLANTEDLVEALATRWRRTIIPEIVEARLAVCAGPMDQAALLLDLIEEAVGRAPVAILGQRLATLLAAPEFTRELGAGWDPGERPRRLAQIAARAGRLPPEVLKVVRRGLRRLAAAAAAAAAAGK